MTQCSDASSATASAAQGIALLVDGPEIDELVGGLARETGAFDVSPTIVLPFSLPRPFEVIIAAVFAPSNASRRNRSLAGSKV